MIVLADADLDRAAAAAAWGGCMMTGQVCMSVERVYVEAAGRRRLHRRSVVDEDARAPRRAERRRRRDRLRPVHEPAPGRDRRAAPRRRRARRAPRVLTGGDAASATGPGIFFEPTVLAGVDHSMLDHAARRPSARSCRSCRSRDADEARPARQREPATASTPASGRATSSAASSSRAASRAARCASTSACSRPAATICPSAASSRAASARVTAASRGSGSSAWRRRSWSSRDRRSEPAWFPYNRKRPAQMEKLMGWLWG